MLVFLVISIVLGQFVVTGLEEWHHQRR